MTELDLLTCDCKTYDKYSKLAECGHEIDPTFEKKKKNNKKMRYEIK